MVKLVGGLARSQERLKEVGFTRLWTHFYTAVGVAFTLYIAQVFGPWLVLEMFQAWTGMPLTLVP